MDNQIAKEELDIEDNLNPSISFKKIYFSLINNKLIILIGIILGFSSSIFVNLTTKETWQGEFEIVLEGLDQPKMNLQDIFKNNNFNFSQNTSTAINTEVGILKSSSVLMDIFEYAQNENLKLDPKYNKISFNGWKSKLDIKLVSGTSILKIKYKDTNKEIILPTLSKISDTYQSYSLKNNELNLDLENKFYKDQIEFYKKKSNESLFKAKSYSEKYDLDVVKNFLSDKLANPNEGIGIEEKSKNAKNKIRLLSELISEVKAARNEPDEIFFLASRIIQEDVLTRGEFIKSSLNKINDIKSELSNYQSIYMANDPIIQNLNADILLLTDFLYKDIMGTLTAEIDISNAVIDASKRPEGVLVKFSQLKSEASRDSNVLFNLENQYRLIMLQRAKEGNPWKLITSPTLNPRPIMPRKSRNMKLGLLLGLILGMVLAVSKQLSKRIILSIKDLNKISKTPLITDISLLKTNDFKDYIDIISEKYNKSNEKLLIYSISPLENEQKNLLINTLKESNSKNIEFQENLKNLKKFTFILIIIKLGITPEEDVIKIERKLSLLDIKIFGFITINDELQKKL